MSEERSVALLRHWCDLSLAGLESAREEIDALNVYPVPDGDTGTNLLLTFEAARKAMLAAGPGPLPGALAALGRGALLGARGSSGVILSQLLRAGSRQLLAGTASTPGRLLADSLATAADAAYQAVGHPVEGTILSVARAAALAAQQSVAGAPDDPAGQPGWVIQAAARAAADALARTPCQLGALQRAGVVDAGGRGLCVLMDAAQEALTGIRPARRTAQPSPGAPAVGGAHAHLTPDGPAYELTFLLDADDQAVAGLRRALEPMGDALVVVGGDRLWKVHIHVDDVGPAVEAAVAAGRPHRIRVVHFADQEAGTAGTGRGRAKHRSLVAFAAGPGLAELFAGAGADVVRTGGRPLTTGEVLAAIKASRAAEVVVLPNDPETLTVAEAAAHAARDDGIRVAVVPTRAQVQGLAAAAVRDPSRSFDDDVVSMTAAAGNTRHGAVTVATRDAMTMAGPCHAGDILGVVQGDFAVVGADLAPVACTVADRLLAGGGELVTLVAGADGPADLVGVVRTHVEQRHPSVEVVALDGRQARYPLLIGVE
ncbi:MAG TPA: DAK2 domain-containing protein [Nocardioidaceae bacterium]|nr:DAK2 domain-containing protein [Nocardioidaceae bacterium]